MSYVDLGFLYPYHPLCYLYEIMKEILVKSASVYFRRNKKKFCITLSTESSVGSAFHREKNEQKIAKNYDTFLPAICPPNDGDAARWR